jgi:sirohydrochlorin cobaltochelatase
VRDHGLLIVGHGTRYEPGLAEFRSTAEQVAQRLPGTVVEGCFLELAQPSLEAGIDRAVERGVERLVIAPLVLFPAGHAKQDIPALVAAAAARHPRLVTRQAIPLGCHPSIVELSTIRCQQALDGRQQIATGDTLLLMVGRGSRDADANSEMFRFARLRWERFPAGWLETCFVAMTEPSLGRALAMASRLPVRRIVVQPHLLFQGELLHGVRHLVSEFSRRLPAIDWVITGHLGADALLADALIDRCREAIERPA